MRVSVLQRRNGLPLSRERRKMAAGVISNIPNHAALRIGVSTTEPDPTSLDTGLRRYVGHSKVTLRGRDCNWMLERLKLVAGEGAGHGSDWSK